MLGPILEMATLLIDERVLSRIVPLFDDPDIWVRSFAHFIHAEASLNLGRLDGIEEDYDRALAGFRSLRERWGTSLVMISKAELESWNGRHQQAVSLYDQALVLLDELGAGYEMNSHVYHRLAGQLWLLGDKRRAVGALHTAERLAEQSGNREASAFVQFQFGEFARLDGDLDAADRYMAGAEERVRQLTGPPQVKAIALAGFGHLRLAHGDLAGARSYFMDALKAAVSVMDLPVIGNVMSGFSASALRTGDTEQAAELVGSAVGLRGCRDQSLVDEVRTLAEVKQALPDATFTAAYERGRARSVEETLALFGLERPPPESL